MEDFPRDIYTEPEPDVDTLANLGPLAGMAGIWTGSRGLDVNPKADGPERQAFIEHMELQPIDAQTNGPQLLYGLRYHTRIVKPGEVEAFHDQVGYWLWEPATGTVTQTVAIPRGQTAMAVGRTTADAKTFSLQAVRGSLTNGIVSNPFLEYAFRTEDYTATIAINPDGTWSYELVTTLVIPGQAEPFRHTDRNTLHKIGEPTPNPMALAAAASRQPPPQAFDPSATYALLAASGKATSLPGGEAFWSQPEPTLDGMGKDWLITEFECSSNWTNWEMHPHADEFVYLLSGSATLVLETAGGPTKVPLLGRAAVLVPKGTWHTAEVSEPSRMLFVTMGAETKHRPA